MHTAWEQYLAKPERTAPRSIPLACTPVRIAGGTQATGAGFDGHEKGIVALHDYRS